jgi:hypothetical protein
MQVYVLLFIKLVTARHSRYSCEIFLRYHVAIRLKPSIWNHIWGCSFVYTGLRWYTAQSYARPLHVHVQCSYTIPLVWQLFKILYLYVYRIANYGQHQMAA